MTDLFCSYNKYTSYVIAYEHIINVLYFDFSKNIHLRGMWIKKSVIISVWYTCSTMFGLTKRLV